MARKKANNAEMEARVTAVYKLLLRGATRQNILDHATKEEWDVTPRQIDTYTRRANALFKKQAKTVRAVELGTAKAQLKDLYAAAFRISDNRTALAIRAEMSKLEGLYPAEPPKTLQVLGMDNDTAQRLAALLEQRGLSAADVFNALLSELATSERQDE